MANPEHVELINQGPIVFNEWRHKNKHIQIDLSLVDLHGVDLQGINLHRVDIHMANLQNAILRGANLQDADLEDSNLKGADLWGANLQIAYLQNADLEDTNLQKANLSGANLRGTNCYKAILRKTNFSGSDLQGADFHEADLQGANLYGAYLEDTNFQRANLQESNLWGAHFQESVLQKTILWEAICGNTTFNNVDLSETLGLETVKHEYPSSIGIDTLFESKGKIPRVFLEGAGIPDSLIDYLPSLIGSMKPIQYYSCFISHSSKDEEFCRRLFSRLRDEHLRVWYAPEDMKGGRKTFEQIEGAIRFYDKLLLVLSKNSMKSEWVMSEIRWARKREIKEKKRVLFPIRLVDMDKIKEWACFDADTGKDLAIEVREYHIPDFSNWKDHDSFEKNFKHLLNDLRAKGSVK